MDQKKIGQFLKKLRNEKGLTQEQLAKEFNVSNRTISRWETGNNLPDISLLVEIADFYDVDVREIIDGERKSEKMDSELREVADKMADYAGNEKRVLLRIIQIVGVVGVVFSLLALVLQTINYDPNNIGRIFATIISFFVFCIMSFITLYVTGSLKRIAKHKKLVNTIKIITIILSIVGSINFLFIMFIAGLLFFDSVLSQKVVQKDPSGFNEYIHTEDPTGGNGEMFDVLPQTLNGLDVTEYQLTYYNPWDAQYITYFTIDFGEDYAEEMDRLTAIGIDPYKGMYSVTDEPDGYDIVSMRANGYSGFVYAMIPEGADDSNTKITYVGIVFCNYFLDLKIEKYMKDDYLLKGFDATSNNPYRKEQMKLNG
ncbi:MAG: helix-turn-helix transcriptional regulator [Clostridiales bacterium]|nr:helix-turn-helix transcriptional regulator [Clostridiales bacterium]